MRILVSAKHSLYKIGILGFIAFILGGCIGGGDTYKSKICSYNCNNDCQYYLEVSNDKKKVRYSWVCYGSGNTNWVDLQLGGTGSLNNSPKFEISNKQFRIYYGNKWGNWANLCGSDTSYVKYTYGSNVYEVKVEVNNGLARLCYKDNWSTTSWACGKWVAFDKAYAGCVSCPSGYTYNPTTKLCEADPIIDYTCPYAGGTCVEQSRGIAYCSPYNCNSTNIGTWCATGNIDTTNMTTNSIGMWQCSYDSSWFTDETACKTGCNYFKCSYNNNWYQGDKSVCELNCREQGQCTEVNQ
ncbi:putative lipoprotein (plasmid) [Persephonella marina EX-H1]|uniref:Putative lipoprotein n=1 Tax=Persephonella marina (strain DSM 14350 / EX-H1) TaxID=123214 RepID=C0QUU9_PERMH|nr:hypothetical protein [Persephonella marina]ACO04954.1 putative lipoprotein [Persephonella marina EX-H1]